MIKHLPRNIRNLLEKHGVEGDSITAQNDDMIIKFDDLDTAFAVREATLDFHSCCLINNEGLPALLIHNILNREINNQ